MAYMNQEKKAKLMPGIKAVLKKYNAKATVGVSGHMSLVVKIKQNPDLGLTKVCCINHHWIDTHYSGITAQFLNELKAAAMNGNHDRSDSMVDYFDVGWYLDMNVVGA